MQSLLLLLVNKLGICLDRERCRKCERCRDIDLVLVLVDDLIVLLYIHRGLRCRRGLTWKMGLLLGVPHRLDMLLLHPVGLLRLIRLGRMPSARLLPNVRLPL